MEFKLVLIKTNTPRTVLILRNVYQGTTHMNLLRFSQQS